MDINSHVFSLTATCYGGLFLNAVLLASVSGTRRISRLAACLPNMVAAYLSAETLDTRKHDVVYE